MLVNDQSGLRQVKAIGNFLSTYYTDLLYIRNFQRYKQGKFPKLEYLKKGSGTFYQFLIEFRIMRNVDKNKVPEFLSETLWCVKGSTLDNVDGFASHLKNTGITHNKLPTSLASKILFLNNPLAIKLYDNQAKRALRYKGMNYKEFLELVRTFGLKHRSIAGSSFKIISLYLELIESQFGTEIKDVNQIRFNRFIDKLAWLLNT